jgi:hypothetical protein
MPSDNSAAGSTEITGSVPESACQKSDKTKGGCGAGNKQAADNKEIPR